MINESPCPAVAHNPPGRWVWCTMVKSLFDLGGCNTERTKGAQEWHGQLCQGVWKDFPAQIILELGLQRCVQI